MADTFVIDDLAEPRFPAGISEILGMLAEQAEGCPLELRVLHDRAAAETGLDDFGAGDYRDRLELVLCGYRSMPG